MIFGISPGDFLAVIQLTRKAIEDIKSAPKDFSETEKTVQSLNILLESLNSEIQSETSVLKRDPESAERFEFLVKLCEKPLERLNEIVEKYSSLGTKDPKLLARLKFPKKTVLDIQQELARRYANLSAFLETLGLCGIGRIEHGVENTQRKIDVVGDQIDDMHDGVAIVDSKIDVLRLQQTRILHAVERIAVERSRTPDTGSILSDHTNDNKAVWRQLRRDLICDGFMSSDIEQHKMLIHHKLIELQQSGVLEWDGASVADDSTTSTVTYIGHPKSNYLPPTIASVLEDAAEDSASVDFEVDNFAEDDDGSLSSRGKPRASRALEPYRSTHQQPLQAARDRRRSVRTEKSFSEDSGEEVATSIGSEDDEQSIHRRYSPERGATQIGSRVAEAKDARLKGSRERLGTAQSITSDSSDQHIPITSNGGSPENEEWPIDQRYSQKGRGTQIRQSTAAAQIYHAEPQYDKQLFAGRRSRINIVWRYRRRDEMIKRPGAARRDKSRETILGDYRLPLAAERGDVEQVENLLQRGLDIEATGHSGRTALWRAACAGDLQMAHLLLRRGANPNVRVKDVPLIWYVVGREVEMLRLLLEYNVVFQGADALHRAAELGKTSAVQLLLDYGADVDEAPLKNKSLVNPDSPLISAAQKGHTDILKLLLQEGANHAVVLEAHGPSALFEAVRTKSHACATLLLSYGANPDLKVGANGETALYRACTLNDVRMVQLLLRRNADPNIYCKRASLRREIKMLFGSPLIFELRPAESGPLHAAAEYGGSKMVKLLLTYGADVLAETRQNLQAVDIAAKAGKERTVQLLLDAGGGLREDHSPEALARERKRILDEAASDDEIF